MDNSGLLSKFSLTNYESAACCMLFMSDAVFVTGKYSFAQTMDWLSVLISALISIPFVLLFYRMTYKAGDNIFVKILAVLISTCAIVITLSCFYDFIKTSVLTGSIVITIPIGIILIALYSSLKSFNALKRSVHIIIPVFAVFFLFSAILLMPEADADKVSVIPHTTSLDIFKSVSICSIIFFVKGCLFIFLIKREKGSKNIAASVSAGIFFYGIIMSGILLLTLSVLGPGLYEVLDYPVYYPLGLTGYGSYFERADILSLIMFMTALTYKTGIYFRIIAQCITKPRQIHHFRRNA